MVLSRLGKKKFPIDCKDVQAGLAYKEIRVSQDKAQIIHTSYSFYDVLVLLFSG